MTPKYYVMHIDIKAGRCLKCPNWEKMRTVENAIFQLLQAPNQTIRPSVFPQCSLQRSRQKIGSLKRTMRYLPTVDNRFCAIQILYKSCERMQTITPVFEKTPIILPDFATNNCLYDAQYGHIFVEYFQNTCCANISKWEWMYVNKCKSWFRATQASMDISQGLGVQWIHDSIQMISCDIGYCHPMRQTWIEKWMFPLSFRAWNSVERLRKSFADIQSSVSDREMQCEIGTPLNRARFNTSNSTVI